MERDFNRIFKEHGPLLSRVCASYEANPDLRQELLQEVSLAVWQALQSFKQDCNMKTYILRVAHNRAVNHVKYQTKQPRPAPYSETDVPFMHPSPDSETQLNQSQQIERLLQAVRQLPVNARQVVTLSLEGLSYDEIAEVSGLQKSNVGVMLNRARKQLAEKMKHD